MAIRQLFISMRTVLPIAAVLGGMTVAATPAAASTATAPTCGPKNVTPYQAPGIGKTEDFTVGDGGTVTLLQKSNTKLKVTEAHADSGWKVNVVTSGSSTRPHVGFQRVGVPADQERFWARMNTQGTPGTVINVVIQSCT